MDKTNNSGKADNSWPTAKASLPSSYITEQSLQQQLTTVFKQQLPSLQERGHADFRYMSLSQDTNALLARAHTGHAAASSVMPELVSQMNQAIFRMPEAEKRDLAQARQTASAIIDSESNPLKFLQCCNMDATAAAKRLAAYWKHRVLSFGERAYQPMAFGGALTDQEHDYLMAGQIVILPPDKKGRSIMCIDDSRRMDHDPSTRKRATFYIANLLSQNSLSQTEGIQGISIVQAEPNFDEYSIDVFRLFAETMPVKILCWHVIDHTPSGSAREQFDALFGPILRFPCSFHRHDNVQEYAKVLESFNIHSDGLPRNTVGGKWSYRQFLQWLLRHQGKKAQTPISAAAAAAPSTLSVRYETEESQEEEEEDFFKDLLTYAMSIIPETDKGYYTEAVERASPETWQHECNISSFFQREDYNFVSAARRLAKYWRLRSEVFADKRFSLLNQSTEDALGRKDMNIMNTMFLVLLPSDESGCPVLWIDPGRLSSHPNQDSVDRCLFYFFSLMAENDASCQEGGVVLYNYREERPTKTPVKQTLLQNLVASLPLRIKAVHLIRQSDQVIPEDAKSLFDFAQTVFVHNSSSPSTLVARLARHGVKPDSLPKSLGGSWGLERFCQWQEIRTRSEWKLPLGLLGRNASPSHLPSIRLSSQMVDSDERKRRLNVIHTRRTRDRTRVQVELLQEQADDLEASKRRLVAENQRLQQLVREAQSILAQTP